MNTVGGERGLCQGTSPVVACVLWHACTSPTCINPFSLYFASGVGNKEFHVMRASPQRHKPILEYWKEQLDFDSQEERKAIAKGGG